MIIRENSNSYHPWKKNFLRQLRSLRLIPRQLRCGHRISEETPVLSSPCHQAFGVRLHHSPRRLLLTLRHYLLCVMMAHLINRPGTILTALVAVEAVAGKSCLPSWTVMCKEIVECGIHRPLLKTWRLHLSKLPEGWALRFQIKECRPVHSGCREEVLIARHPHPPYPGRKIFPSRHPPQWEGDHRLMTSQCGRGHQSKGAHVH